MKKSQGLVAACLCCFTLFGWSVLAQQSGSTEGKSLRFTLDDGAIVRGDLQQKQIALIFTGGDYGEGTEAILNALDKLQIKAGLFVTGGFLSKAERRHLVERAVAEGQYVGPHSDQHPLYCPWDDRDKSLITETEFKKDLRKNIADLKALGALKAEPIYFIPPYEWFNADQVKWAKQMGVVMFNFSPGSGSNRDYMPESDAKFVSSQKILQDILAYEKKDAHGLNGYILLLHLGADRQDKMFLLVEPLVQELRARGYAFVRIDAMLNAAKPAN
ncbi:MAG TPA: polysaccharide deacetylase family protein [Verrucomicrobiae bacterium]|nr:polysaccharide deacetylase family protein [Verrucomicrobiae bacterium]